MNQKVVLKIDINDDFREQKKALEKVSSIYGVDSVSFDKKGKKMTVTGLVDPLELVAKLRKSWFTDIISVGPEQKAAESVGTKKAYGTNNNIPYKAYGTHIVPYYNYPYYSSSSSNNNNNNNNNVPYYYPTPQPAVYYVNVPPQNQYYTVPYTPSAPQATYYNVQSAEEDPNSCVIS